MWANLILYANLLGPTGPLGSQCPGDHIQDVCHPHFHFPVAPRFFRERFLTIENQ